MPYAPTVNFEAGILGRGIADAGNSIFRAVDSNEEDKARKEQLKQNKELATLQLAQTLGIHKDVVKQHAEEMLMNLTNANADRGLKVQENNDLNKHREAILDWDKTGGVPVNADFPGMGGGWRIPKTGAYGGIAKKPAPAPGDKSEIPIFDGANNTGKIVAKMIWDPGAGKYTTHDVRPRAENPLAELLKSGGLGAPAMPAGAGQGMAGPGVLPSPEDADALAWAKANPSDPRAAKIISRLGAH